ncbi:MAG: aminoacetone oxidase family FAD-binding enzyme, partial [Cardiobacterium hominis]
MTYDAIIIGAGAAGTYCAIHAANRGLRVLLLDHNPEPGAKIRVSGGGRCNITNLDARADTYYSHNPHFPRGALARHPPQDVLDWFGARGINWHEKHRGQIFADQRSRGILAALHDALADSGATLHTATTLHEHQHDGSHYHLRTSRGDYRSPRLVIACGAPSYPKLGATDLALRIAKQHHIANYPYRPALVPLTLADPPAALAGISHDVIAQCDGAPAFRDQLLYTHRGISGPAVLQISTWWQRGATITLNHLPDLPADALVAAKRAHPQHTLAQTLRAHLPKAVADHLALPYPAD